MKFLADENFKGPIFSALLNTLPDGSLVRVQDVGLGGKDDLTILEWAARNGFVILTHDFGTFTGFAYDRVARGLPMPGVIQIRPQFDVKVILEAIELVFECVTDDELRDLVLYLPS